MRQTLGLGEPPSNITARSFLPVRSTIVVTGSRGTGLIGLLSSLAAFLSLIKGYAAMGIHSSVRDATYDVFRGLDNSRLYIDLHGNQLQ